MGHDRGCPCGREKYEADECPKDVCTFRDGWEASQPLPMTGRLTRTPHGTQFVPTLKAGVTGRTRHTEPEIQQIPLSRAGSPADKTFAHMVASSDVTVGHEIYADGPRRFFPLPGTDRLAAYRRFLDLDDDDVLTRAFEVAQRDLAFYRANPKDEPSIYRGALLTMHALVLKLAAQVIALENQNKESA